MLSGNYDKIIEKISLSANLDKEEIERRIEAKRAKLSGLISKEGAAQVIAGELGISFENEKLKIDELLSGMRKVKIVGKIISFSPIRTFTTKAGAESKVMNVLLADETSNIKVVLWDTNHISLFEKGIISEGKVVEIGNGNMRDNELHLGSFSELKLSEESLENVKTEKIVKDKNLIDAKIGDTINSRAFIVQVFEPRFFYVCPDCSKKVVSGSDGFICIEHSKVIPEKRALINIVLDDGTETIRSVLFHEKLKDLGLTELENSNALEMQKTNLLGKEMIFSGNIRLNKFFNNSEFIVESAKDIDLDLLIETLEKN